MAGWPVDRKLLGCYPVRLIFFWGEVLLAEELDVWMSMYLFIYLQSFYSKFK
jgi:hypothetical protein